MDNRDKSDESLMEAAREGSRSALEVLIRRFASRLLTFLVRLTGGIHAAEEVFQETFGAVWEKRATYKVGRAFRPWLYAIAVNQHRQRARRATVRGTGVPPEEVSADPHTDPAELRERAHAAEAALANLPDRQREVLVLHVYGGLSYAQIGECLGVGEATARGHMFQALATLRRELNVEPVREARKS